MARNYLSNWVPLHLIRKASKPDSSVMWHRHSSISLDLVHLNTRRQLNKSFTEKLKSSRDKIGMWKVVRPALSWLVSGHARSHVERQPPSRVLYFVDGPLTCLSLRTLQENFTCLFPPPWGALTFVCNWLHHSHLITYFMGLRFYSLNFGFGSSL